jgi:hypothetical protein
MAEVREAQEASSYFWFLSGAPEAIDRIDTVHTPTGDERSKWGAPRRDPAKIRPTRVHYYRNPLERLVKLHQSNREMLRTGSRHRSSVRAPWEHSRTS